MHSQSTDRTWAESEGLVHRVAARLQNRLGEPVRDFHMTPRDDGLVLHGRVRTYYGKQLAQQVAMEVSGLSIAANEIEVH